MEDTKEKIEEFEIIFKNGALENLTRLADQFDSSENDGLRLVVAKAIRLLTYVKDAKEGKVFFKDKKGDTFNIDIDTL